MSHARSLSEAKALLNELFATHDVVLFGEAHGIHENLQLVMDLIPWLPTIGVDRLAIEFGAEEFQNQVDALVTADNFDEHAARDIVFGYNAGWPYVEYQDVYRAAWQYNTSNPNTPFRVINSSYVFAWDMWTGARDAETMKRIFRRGYFNEFRANRILDEVRSGHKVLGLYGAFHVMKCDELPFSVDWLDREKPALGQILLESIPVATVGLHPDEANANVWNAPGAFDAFITITDTPTACAIDEQFLDGRDFSEIVRSWPDPDWTPAPTDVADYWRIITSRKLA